MHEEGRIRLDYPNVGQPAQYTYDYFVKDHLGNVRAVLTEQTNQQLYLASMEAERSATENALFSNIESSRSAKPAGYPQDASTGNQNTQVAKLNGNHPDKRVGPSLVLKVMAGDTISIGAKAFYKSIGIKQDKSKLPVGDMAAALLRAFGEGELGGGHKEAGSAGAVRSPFNDQFVNDGYRRMKEKEPQDGPQVDRPKAYLNFALFDEDFNLVEENSGVRQVKAEPDQLQTLAQDKMVITKGGFLYVYTSNETPQDVFFDNLTVVTNPGALLEETHYYPYGLTMQGISSIAMIGANYTKNRKEYNGIEHTTDLNMNQYDAFYRTLDPQIGRFWQIDPEVEALSSSSPYESMGNNPVTFVDPLGDFKTHFGAWWHRLWHGGEDIGKNEFDEWYVTKSTVSKGDDGVTTVTSSKYYGKGRNQFSSAWEKWEAEQQEQKLEEQWTKAGIWDPNLSPDQAGRNAANLGLTVTLPNVLLKQATTAANATKAVNTAANKSLQELQAIAKQNAPLFRKLFGTGKEGAQAVLNNVKNVKVPEGLTKEAMQAYRELINRVPDPAGTQAIRAKILDHLLK
jgi:RHS repeat-associated protein